MRVVVPLPTITHRLPTCPARKNPICEIVACCSQAQKLAVDHDRVRLQLTDDPNGIVSTPLLRTRPRGGEVEPEDVERSVTGIPSPDHAKIADRTRDLAHDQGRRPASGDDGRHGAGSSVVTSHLGRSTSPPRSHGSERLRETQQRSLNLISWPSCSEDTDSNNAYPS